MIVAYSRLKDLMKKIKIKIFNDKQLVYIKRSQIVSQKMNTIIF